MKKWVANACIRIALTSKYTKWQHGALVELGGSIIAKGTNSIKPLAPQDSKYSTHAEICVLKQVRFKGIGGTLHVARVNRQGIVKNSKPCAECEAMLRVSSIRRVCYSIGPDEWGVLEL